MEFNHWDNSKSYPVPSRKRFVLWLVVGIVGFSISVLVSYRLVRSFQYLQENNRIRDGYVQNIERLKLEQESLKEELYKIQYNRLAKERLARELGYIKPGETVYKIIPTNQ